MVTVFVCSLLNVLNLYIRIRPRLYQKNFGIDSWYFLLCADIFRRTKKVPIKLPYYILDINEQWYPPIFPIILALIPQRFLKKYQWIISPLIDTIQMNLLFFIVFFLTKSIGAAFVGTLFYATSPILATQNSNLNSRGLGSLFLSCTILGLCGLTITATPIFLLYTLLFGALVLYTHKLATQQLFFLMIGFSIFYLNPNFFFILVSIILIATILSGGFYFKILKGHIEILKFWKKNLPFLWAHQIYQSPLYREKNKAITKRGCRGIVASQKWFNLAKAQFIILFGAIAFYSLVNRQNFTSVSKFFLNWYLINFLTVGIINYFPPVKFLGEGQRYFMYGIFPASFLLSQLIFLSGLNMIIGGILFVIIILMNILLIHKIHTDQEKNILAIIDTNLNQVLDYINRLPKDNIMSFPVSHCDHIAFFCRKKTLWGGHSCGYDKLQPFFPILLEPIEHFIRTYNVSYCLFNKFYIDLDDLHLSLNYKILLENEKFWLLEVYS
jgi:hypothetical protein